jgi:hypothetical protein
LRVGNRSGAGEAKLEDVSLAYLPRNVAPEVLAISVLAPGIALQQQIQIQVDPNIEASGSRPLVVRHDRASASAPAFPKKCSIAPMADRGSKR